MLTKRKVKIIILFVLLLICIGGMWRMQKRMSYNKRIFGTDIYSCIPPEARQIIHINRIYSFDKMTGQDPDLTHIISDLSSHISYPVIISEDTDNSNIVIIKTNLSQSETIKKILDKDVTLFAPKRKIYKHRRLLIYTLANGQFLVCAFHDGIFTMSKNLKLVEKFIDIDPKNTFFSTLTNKDDKELMLKIRNNSQISIFTPHREGLLAFEYSAYQDSTILDGYILREDYTQPIDSCIAYRIHIPDSLCIDNAHLENNDKRTSLRLKLLRN